MNNSTIEISRLVSDIKLHRYLYYNKESRISDAAYDGLIERLKQLDPTNPELLKVGAPFPKDSGWQKANHLMAMSSLQNAMSVQEFDEWVKRTKSNGAGVVLEDKADGLSIELIYDAGKLVQAITRGDDGIVGEDITINVKKMKRVRDALPKKISACVRGEIILLKEDFKKLNDKIKDPKKKYKNERNAASGICKRFDGKDSESLCVLVYDINSSDVSFKYEIDKMDYLDNVLGLMTVNYQLSDTYSVVEFREQYSTKTREELPYNIDGIVVKINDLSYQKKCGLCSNGDPMGQIAFKFDARGVATKLLDIIWTMGRTGVLTPNAVIEPVLIDGTTVKAATLHNFDEIERLKVGIGDTVLVIKAGEIIPKVTEVIKSAGKKYKIPTYCPSCNGPVERDGAFLFCNNENCLSKEFKVLKHFIDVLKKRTDMEGLGQGIIIQLVEKEIVKEPADFYKLTIDNMLTLERMGQKVAKKIIDNFNNCKELDLATFLNSLAIPSLGETMSNLLVEEGYDSLDKILKATEADLTKISGIGPSRARDVVNGLKEKKSIINNLINIIKVKEGTREIMKASNKLSGKSFCVTGAFVKINPETEKPYLRDDWEAFVEENGGKISSVKKGLDYLVVIKTDGGKAEKAEKLGITMISENEFWTMID